MFVSKYVLNLCNNILKKFRCDERLFGSHEHLIRYGLGINALQVRFPINFKYKVIYIYYILPNTFICVWSLEVNQCYSDMYNVHLLVYYNTYNLCEYTVCGNRNKNLSIFFFLNQTSL